MKLTLAELDNIQLEIINEGIRVEKSVMLGICPNCGNHTKSFNTYEGSIIPIFRNRYTNLVCSCGYTHKKKRAREKL